MSSIKFKLRFEEDGISIGIADVINTLSRSYLETNFALYSSFYLSSFSFKIVGWDGLISNVWFWDSSSSYLAASAGFSVYACIIFIIILILAETCPYKTNGTSFNLLDSVTLPTCDFVYSFSHRQNGVTSSSGNVF